MPRMSLKRCRERAERTGWVLFEERKNEYGGWLEYRQGEYRLVYYFNARGTLTGEECSEIATGTIIAARNHKPNQRRRLTGNEKTAIGTP